jgi:hypothetical protein
MRTKPSSASGTKVSGTAGAITSSPDNLATDSVWIETDLVEPATIGAADTQWSRCVEN